MAPLPVIASTYRVAFNWKSLSITGTAENVMHFREGATGVEDLSVALTNNIKGPMWQHTSSNSIIDSWDVTPLDGGGLTSHVLAPTTADFHGQQAAGDILPQVCALVKHVTGTRGRSHRGRSYLPWMAEIIDSNGLIDPGNVATGQAAWSAFLHAMQLEQWNPVVASYTLAEATDITAYVYERPSATQRRRMKR